MQPNNVVVLPPVTTKPNKVAVKLATKEAAKELTSEDYTLLNELWTTIEREPSCTHPRKVLVEQLVSFGWIDAALEAAQEVLNIEPTDAAMLEFVKQHSLGGSGLVLSSNTKKVKVNVTRFRAEKIKVPKTDEERHSLELQFIEALNALQERASILLQDTRAVTEQRRLEDKNFERDEQMEKLRALSNGQFKRLATQNSNSARAVARAIEEAGTPEKALEVAIADLETIYSRLKSSSDPPNNDAIRETLAKRCRILGAALSLDLQDQPILALMHMEHEKLGRTYQNDESMLGDPISDIPREDFWTSEDGYAWSMDELSQAITSNGGVMRNPLSREMFSITDIRRIIQHPSGRRLAAMQLEQSKMSKGVRPSTIEHLENMAKTFLADMSEDQKASRLALDEFFAHVATLPKEEQDAIDNLRVPAKDSHTGQEFDCTIGDAVRDARANKICIHKTGDLLGQAAKYLRQANT